MIRRGTACRALTMERFGKSRLFLKLILKPCYNTLQSYFSNARIAQLVEQLTLNQWVQGSSPCAGTSLVSRLVTVREPRRLDRFPAARGCLVVTDH